MSQEHLQPRQPSAAEAFGLCEDEKRDYQVSHARFLELLNDPQTQVHRIEETTNSYGEYLFVTMSRFGTPHHVLMTFYSLGYHEYRERWMIDEWYWYEPNNSPLLSRPTIPAEDANTQIDERYQMVKQYAEAETQSRQGQLYEIMADLTDEDGALAELEDLSWWLLGQDERNDA